MSNLLIEMTTVLKWNEIKLDFTVNALNMGTVSRRVSYILRFLQAVFKMILLKVVRSMAHNDPWLMAYSHQTKGKKCHLILKDCEYNQKKVNPGHQLQSGSNKEGQLT